MKIWLETNLKTHHFIAAEYWISHYHDVEKALKQADIFCFEENNFIKGFIGILPKNYIAGLFVSPPFQSQGIGRSLIKECKRHYPLLSLNVFVKNRRAISFYQKQEFFIREETMNLDLQEKEYLMEWPVL